MAAIAQVVDEPERRVVRRLFAEYQRATERLLAGTDVCP
ncbi:MAG: hypothetical protein ACI81L_003080 [Verrucomicrobiales bacterium]|jgi:hypothetical protein